MKVLKMLISLFLVSVLSVSFADDVDELIKKLGSDEWKEREDASKALAEKGESIIPTLLKAYKETEDFEVKSRIVTILEKLGYPSPEEMERIEKAVSEYEKMRFPDGKEGEEDGKEKQKKENELLDELSKIKHSADYLVRLLATEMDVEKRSKAVAELLDGLISGVGNIPGFKWNLPKKLGPGAKVRMKLVVVRSGKKRVVVVEDGKVVRGGGIDHNATPLTALLRVVREAEERRLKIRAIGALGLRGEKGAVSELLKLLESSDDELRNAAAEALRRITGNDFGPYRGADPEKVEEELKKWKEWWDANKDKEEYQPPKLQGEEKEEPKVGLPEENELKRMMKRLEELRKEMLKRQLERKEEEKKEKKKEEEEDEDVGEF